VREGHFALLILSKYKIFIKNMNRPLCVCYNYYIMDKHVQEVHVTRDTHDRKRM